MKIYVASSWRNLSQPYIVMRLRSAGHEVYDFRNPRDGEHSFHWSEIDPQWQSWELDAFRSALQHPAARSGFASNFAAMEWADTCVLVLPCGRSAHLEAGWFIGQGKPVFILMTINQEPELMYNMATVVTCEDELTAALKVVGNENQMDKNEMPLPRITFTVTEGASWYVAPEVMP